MNNNTLNLSIILLAAGDSKRFQGNKMLVKVEGKPMYLHMVEKIQDIPALNRVLVTQYQEIIDSMSDSFKDTDIKMIRNTHSERGISYSIRIGIEFCTSCSIQKEEEPFRKDCDAYLFAVCDQPWLKKESLQKLIDVFSNSKKGIACLSYHGSLGNPVIFDAVYKSELLNLMGDTGGKSIVKKHRDDVELVEVIDPMELLDIDTRNDYFQQI